MITTTKLPLQHNISKQCTTNHEMTTYFSSLCRDNRTLASSSRVVIACCFLRGTSLKHESTVCTTCMSGCLHTYADKEGWMITKELFETGRAGHLV